MKFLQTVTFLLLLGMFSYGQSSAQNTEHTVSGVVTDQNDGSTLPGVNILVKGTTIGTSTDTEGSYQLTVPSASDTLVFSFIGYQTQVIPIQGRSVIDVALVAKALMGEELVVVGYGEQTREDLTGSISSVGAERISEQNVDNLGQALQGQVAGAQVIQQGGGEPGGRPMIRVRGTNSINTNSDPLFVVDGISGVSNPLSNLNPRDIESINVLKGPSATAIYGARGANGVVIIETKRGTEGPVGVEYNGSVTMGYKNRNVYALTPDQIMYVYQQSFANGDKFGGTRRELDFNAATSTGGDTWSDMTHLFESVPKGEYFLNLRGADGNYYRPRFNSNWADLTYNRSVSTNQYLRISGGDESAQYSFSFGYNKEDGLMKESWLQRYNGKVTADYEVFDWLDINSQVSFTKRDKTNDEGITRTVTEVWSILPRRYPNNPDIFGSYAGRWGTSADFGIGESFWNNPLFIRDQNEGRITDDQMTGAVAINADISNNITFRSNFAIDYLNSTDNNYTGLFYGGLGEASIDNETDVYWQNESYLNYVGTFNENHNIKGQIGFTWSETKQQTSFSEVSGFSTNFYQWNNLSAASQRPSVRSSKITSTLNSYFVRLNYDYKGKYRVTGTGRYDGSSKFGENNKYGFFPSVALAWNISEEDFINNIDAISFLKLRASIGKTGNESIGSYVTQAFVGESSIVMGNGTASGRFPITVGNPDLKWEETLQYDLGLDLGLWQDRIDLSVDYYHKDTNDMLLFVPLPHSTTPGSVIRNFGSVENKGWEFTLSSRNIQTGNFNWQSSINASTNRNEIVQLGPNGAPIYARTGAGRGTSVLMEGKPIGSFWGLNRLGTYSTKEASLAARYGLRPGDLKFEDKNQDGQIDLIDDGQIIGNAFPTWVINVRNSFLYQNFDASITFRIVSGNEKVFIRESGEDRQLVSGGLNSTLQAWRPDHQNTMVAQVRPGSAGSYYQSYADTRMISDASFIRGSNATLGYTFSESLGGRIGIKKLRLYLQASNFLLITNAEGYDPEGSSLGGQEQSTLVPNIDKYQYPRPVRISFGIDLNI